jgi:hypothetical protein
MRKKLQFKEQAYERISYCVNQFIGLRHSLMVGISVNKCPSCMNSELEPMPIFDEK